MKEKVIDIISKITRLDSSELEKNIDKEYLWDSFSHIELIIEIESEFKVRFTPEEITAARSISVILKMLSKKVNI